MMTEWEREKEEEKWTPKTTPALAAREYVWNVGAEQPEREYILTDWDTWERNPYYTGEPGPHPED